MSMVLVDKGKLDEILSLFKETYTIPIMAEQRVYNLNPTPTDDILAVLKVCEWVNSIHAPGFYCQKCGGDMHSGHTPDCALVAVIKKLEGKL